MVTDNIQVPDLYCCTFTFCSECICSPDFPGDGNSSLVWVRSSISTCAYFPLYALSLLMWLSISSRPRRMLEELCAPGPDSALPTLCLIWADSPCSFTHGWSGESLMWAQGRHSRACRMDIFMNMNTAEGASACGGSFSSCCRYYNLQHALWVPHFPPRFLSCWHPTALLGNLGSLLTRRMLHPLFFFLQLKWLTFVPYNRFALNLIFSLLILKLLGFTFVPDLQTPRPPPFILFSCLWNPDC